MTDSAKKDENGSASPAPGPIAWMAKRHLAANLAMALFIVGGLIMLPRIGREVFPEAQLDIVTVRVPVPGATPEDIEEGVIIPIEEALRGIENIETINSSAARDLGLVTAELPLGADPNRVLNDIENAVDRITAFPRAAEDPIISQPSSEQPVLSLLLYGASDRLALKEASDRATRQMLRLPEISRIEVAGLSPPEISIEISQENLRRYNLTLPQIAGIVQSSSVEASAGTIRSPNGEVSVRVLDPRLRPRDFADIAVITSPDGERVTLADIACVRETFRQENLEIDFDGQPAVLHNVYQSAQSSPQAVSSAILDFLEEKQGSWPSKLKAMIWEDQSEIYQERVGLLIRNALMGLGLVLILLGVFLRPGLAFWVTMGIPISFLGAILILPGLDVSINMISLFAFILVLGIVVDDAIVAGEAAYHRRDGKLSRVDAAIEGAREVRTPVLFAVITTILVFIPMLFMPGVTGEFFGVIPKIVIPILAISLIESLLILPAHVSMVRDDMPKAKGLSHLYRWQQGFSDRFRQATERYYTPAIQRIMHWRYVTAAAGLAVLLVTAGLFMGGQIKFVFFPEIEGKIARAQLAMPSGTSFETTQRWAQHLADTARRVVEQESDQEGILRGVLVRVGTEGRANRDPTEGRLPATGSNYAIVEVGFIPLDQRELSSEAFSRAWREAAGEIPGAERVVHSYSVGPSAGAALAFQLSHPNDATLKQAATEWARQLGNIPGVTEIDRGFDLGKEEVRLSLKPAARALGITSRELLAQIRGAYFGIEAFRDQRERDELRVYARFPEAARNSLQSLSDLVIQTGEGDIPLSQAATIQWSQAPTEIVREGGRRVITVTADVDPAQLTSNEVVDRVNAQIAPQLADQYPDLEYEVAGEQEEQRESINSLATGLLLAFLLMYALIATVFNSYVQPLLIFLAVPFGWAGAVVGHIILGYNLSIISVLGMIALSGVVINDSLVLIHAINERRAQGQGLHEALQNGGLRRFRPILLTSLTTFFGLAPMISETSLQARFLVPMAISLGIGVLFVTVITLVLVPAFYRIVEDFRPSSSDSS